MQHPSIALTYFMNDGNENLHRKYSSGLIRAPERERQKCKNESAENIDQSVENECAKFLSTK